MDYVTADSTIRSDRWRRAFPGERLGRNVVEQVTWIQSKASLRPDRLPHDFHIVWYTLIQELRRLADQHEHAAIRDLHEKRSKSWNEVARALGGETTRQAVQQRWSRLVVQFGPAQAI